MCCAVCVFLGGKWSISVSACRRCRYVGLYQLLASLLRLAEVCCLLARTSLPPTDLSPRQIARQANFALLGLFLFVNAHGSSVKRRKEVRRANAARFHRHEARGRIGEKGISPKRNFVWAAEPSLRRGPGTRGGAGGGGRGGGVEARRWPCRRTSVPPGPSVPPYPSAPHRAPPCPSTSLHAPPRPSLAPPRRSAPLHPRPSSSVPVQGYRGAARRRGGEEVRRRGGTEARR